MKNTRKSRRIARLRTINPEFADQIYGPERRAKDAGIAVQRVPYLHVEIEGPRDLTHEEQTDWLLQLSKWMTEAFQAMDVSVTRNNDHWAARGLGSHVVTNKVHNQVPGQRWRNMTPEQRAKTLSAIEES